MPRIFDNILPAGTYRYPGADGDFGPRSKPSPGASSNHQGYDLAAAEGTPVTVPRDGLIVGVGRDAPSGAPAGNWIAVQHTLSDDTVIITRYLHLKEPPGTDIQPGKSIPAGTQIGQVGSTGHDAKGNPVSNGSHLHYEEREVPPGLRPDANGAYPWNRAVAELPPKNSLPRVT